MKADGFDEVQRQVLDFIRKAQAAAERGSVAHTNFLRTVHEATVPGALQKLSAFERAFVREYMLCKDATLSAERAGSKAKSHEAMKQIGYTLRHRPRVAAAIESLEQQAEKEATVSRADVLRGLKSNAENAAKDHQYGASNGAWVQLGKELHGMFSDKLDVRLRGEIQEMLNAARPHMKSESYVDCLQAIAKAMGVAELATTAVGADDGDSGEVELH